MEEIKVKSSTFSSISLETLDTGVTVVTVKQGQDSMSVPLLPEEIGIFLTKLGNAVAEGRAEELKRLEEYNLEKEKRKIRKEDKGENDEV